MTRHKHPAQLDIIDLLREIEARPVVVRLPASAWGGTIWRGDKVMQIAEGMAEEPERAERYWTGAQHIIAQELAAAGATEAEAFAELAKYRAAVTIELCRRRVPRRSGPGAA